MANPLSSGTRPDGTPTAVGTIEGTRYRVVYVVEDGLMTIITVWDEKE